MDTFRWSWQFKKEEIISFNKNKQKNCVCMNQLTLHYCKTICLYLQFNLQSWKLFEHSQTSRGNIELKGFSDILSPLLCISVKWNRMLPCPQEILISPRFTLQIHIQLILSGQTAPCQESVFFFSHFMPVDQIGSWSHESK